MGIVDSIFFSSFLVQNAQVHGEDIEEKEMKNRRVRKGGETGEIVYEEEKIGQERKLRRRRRGRTRNNIK
jgi:hypothetical protein